MLRDLLNIPADGDLCSLTFAAFVLIPLGHVAVGNHRAAAWGPRLALLAFLLWLGSSVVSGGVPTGLELAGLVLQGLAAAGLVLGLTWIISGVCVSCFAGVWQRLRQGLGHWSRHRIARQQWRPQTTEQPARPGTSESSSVEQRERQQREQAERQQQVQQQADAVRRRANARLECELYYDQHAAQLREQFPQERLAAYFKEYLGNEHPPELVEQRKELLLQMLRNTHGEAEPGRKRFQSLEEIADHYAEQRRQIQDNPRFDPETCDTILKALNTQEDQAIEELLH